MNRVLMSLFPFAFLLPLLAVTPAPPAVGDKAPDFALSTPEGKTVQLSVTLLKGPVVLVVLRGYPGYQCPYCNRQVQDFIRNSSRLADAGAQVVMVYPGPPQGLGSRANEFLAGERLPNNFDLVLDPGYDFTKLYGLRWDAAGETAYPSTFLIDQQGVIFFGKISKEHGGRTTAAEIVAALAKRTAAR